MSTHKITPRQVRVGIGVVVVKDDKILLGKRKGSHGEGDYAFPGGHMEFGESIEGAAVREIKEETGLTVINVRFLRVMNFKHNSGKHYVDIGLVADWESGEPERLEPDRIEGWDWYDVDNLPSNLFEPCKSAIESYKTGLNYFDS